MSEANTNKSKNFAKRHGVAMVVGTLSPAFLSQYLVSSLSPINGDLVDEFDWIFKIIRSYYLLTESVSTNSQIFLSK